MEMEKKNMLVNYGKKAGVILLIGALCAGGGTWYHHQQKQLQHAKVMEARAAAIKVQAEKNNMVLLSQDSVRTLAADAIGADETAVTYRKISLEVPKQHKEMKKHEGHKREEITGTEEAAKAVFKPIYSVSCQVDNVKYKLQIDAVSGEALKMDIG